MNAFVASVAVVVRNKERSKEFFRDVLGMQVLDDEGHWVTVGQPGTGARIHLCEAEPIEPGNTGIVIAVEEDIRSAYENMKSKGVKFAVPPTEREWGTECRFLDPDGNELWLFSMAEEGE